MVTPGGACAPPGIPAYPGGQWCPPGHSRRGRALPDDVDRGSLSGAVRSTASATGTRPPSPGVAARPRGMLCQDTLDALDHDRHPADRLARELGLLDATMLVVASIIGAGIFLTPGTVADILPQPGLVLAAWMVGGVLSLAGALANAELAAMFPHAGRHCVC